MITSTMNPGTTFPVDWHSAEDTGATYRFDPMHFPFPVSPLFESTMGPAFAAGFTRAAREYKSPIQEWKVLHRNHYRYDNAVMTQPASEDEARKIAEGAQAALQPELGRLLERWHGEHLPATAAHLERLISMEAQAKSSDDLLALLDEADAIHRDLWTIHFRIAHVMLVAIQLFDEFYTELFGSEDADAQALLVGATSMSVMAGIALSDLAASARKLGLGSVFEDTPVDRIMSRLEATESGRAFLIELQSLLDVYGLRQDLFEYETPTWREDPSIALSNVRNYLRTGYDARAAQISMASTADKSAAAAREKLAAYPRAVREQFETMLDAARHGAFLQEEHNFYIDQQGLSLLRLFYLQIGKRLTEREVLGAPQDVFLLTAEDLRHLVGTQDVSLDVGSVRDLVARRKAEMDVARTMVPPPFLGDPPAGPPPSDDPGQRTLINFFGGPPDLSEEPGLVRGNPGSRGVATGAARIARTLNEAADLEPGEILVATTTMPSWTPLFGVAAAVVTETGGSLSHCAIVAREYGIPAVVGAHGATRRITTGQRITVDGTSGVVTLN